MIHKTFSFFAAILCTFGLAACINLKPVPSQMESFTLGPVDGGIPSGALPQGDPIYILRPQVPTYLDSNRLSYRSSNGEVISMPGTRWAEPLAEGVARAMFLYLSNSEQCAVEGYYPGPNTSPDAARLSLNFQRFGATDSGEVHVIARWTFKNTGGEGKSGQFVSEALSWQTGKPASLVAAYNEALQALAQELKNNLN